MMAHRSLIRPDQLDSNGSYEFARLVLDGYSGGDDPDGYLTALEFIDAHNNTSTLTIDAVGGAITQTGTGQVSFAGNVNATNGLDVTGADLTVSTNVIIEGDLVVKGVETIINTEQLYIRDPIAIFNDSGTELSSSWSGFSARDADGYNRLGWVFGDGYWGLSVGYNGYSDAVPQRAIAYIGAGDAYGDLSSTALGNSGADKIGSSGVPGVDGYDVQSILVGLAEKTTFIDYDPITGTLTFDAYNTIFTGDVHVNGDVYNDGYVHNTGGVINDGYVYNNSYVINNDYVTNNNIVTNNDTVFNNGDVHNNGDVYNDGYVHNTGGVINDGYVLNNGDVTNNGVVTNNGDVHNNGDVYNDGYVHNSSGVINDGYVINNSDVTNNGTVTNNGDVHNNGDVYNDGYVHNSSGVINDGYVINNSTVTNNETVTNNSFVINNETVTNNSTVINNGDVHNNGNVYNDGYVHNSSGVVNDGYVHNNGDTVIGDSSTDTLTINATITSNLLPEDCTYYLGDPTHKWLDAYFCLFTPTHYTPVGSNYSIEGHLKGIDDALTSMTVARAVYVITAGEASSDTLNVSRTPDQGTALDLSLITDADFRDKILVYWNGQLLYNDASPAANKAGVQHDVARKTGSLGQILFAGDLKKGAVIQIVDNGSPA